jgi:outer membrane protein assembly factor BamB
MRQQLSLTPRIFISHSSKDATFALKLVQDLRKVLSNESLVWLDLGELRGGNKWWRMIVEEISSRNIFIVILSPDAVRSKWIDDEIDLAWSRKNATGVGMQIIPVLYRDCQVRDDLKILQMVSFKAPKPYDVAFDELLTAISPPMRVAHIPGTAQRLLNRRAFLISGEAVVLAAAGGAALLVYELHDHRSIGSSPTPSPNPTQTAIAQAKNDYEKNFAANGIMYGFNAQHTRTNPYEIILNTDNVSGLKLFWKASTKGKVSSSPTVANGVVYVGSDDGNLYAFDTNNGATLWNALTGGSIHSSPAVAPNRVVYAGSDDGYLYAFDPGTGNKPLWTAKTGNSITSSPTLVNGIVYIGSWDKTLYAFNATSGGKPLWTFSTGNALFGSPAVVNGVVYIGSRDGNLYAFNAISNLGSELWHALTSSANNTGNNGIETSPTVANGVVYIASDDGHLYAFNANTGGTPLWTFPVGAFYSCPAVVNGVIYIGSEFNNALYAFHLP